MKAALYIRVSTKEQVENYSIPSQKEKLEAYCKAHGWEIYDHYIDGGYSGSNMDRPDLQRMLKEIHNIDIVVVYKLDRLSRSQRDTLELIEDHFLKNDVEFASITENLDTSTPMGRMMIGVLSAFAQLEREMIAERMYNGNLKRAQEGYASMGGDYDPAGYKRYNGQLVIKPDEKKHIQEAFNLYEQYHSITKVQEELKLKGFPVWRFRRYRDILSNKLYIGYVSFGGKYYKGKHEPIISKEQFERVQALLKRHKGNNAHKPKRSLLSGLIVCDCCGENYVTYSVVRKRNGNSRTYRYYICKARRFPSEYPKKCMNKNWNSEKLEKIIIEEIRFLSTEKDAIAEKKNKIDYQKQIKKIDEKIERILLLYAEGKFNKEMLDKQVDIMNAEKEYLLKRKKEEDLLDNDLTSEEIKKLVIDLKNVDFHAKRSAIEKLVKQIRIDGENVQIKWNF